MLRRGFIRQREPRPSVACREGCPGRGLGNPHGGNVVRAPPGKTHGRVKYSSRNTRHEEPLRHTLPEVPHHRRLSVNSRENRSIMPPPRSLLLGGALTLRFLRALWLGLRCAAWF